MVATAANSLNISTIDSVVTTTTAGAPVATSLAVDGQLIIGSGSGAPSAATLTAGSGISVTNGANSITIAATGGGGSGSVVQQIRTTSTTATSTSTSLSSVVAPTTSNTVSVISLTITPTSTNNFLYFEFTAPFWLDVGAGSGVGFFIFNGSTFVSGFPFTGGTTTFTGYNTGDFTYYKQVTSTSSQTFSIYYAVDSGGGTVYLLQNSALPLYGATGATSIQFTVTEVLP